MRHVKTVRLTIAVVTSLVAAYKAAKELKAHLDS